MDNVHPIFSGILDNFRKSLHPAKWEIQTHFFDGSWSNCWTNLSTGQPQRFETEEAAQAELDNYLKGCKLAVDDGDITDHKPDDYRIVKV